MSIKKTFLLVTLILVILSSYAYTFHTAKAATQTVTYCNNQELDVIAPSANATSSNPAIIQVHGGAWMGGNKLSIDAMEPGPILPDAFNQLSAKGFVIVSIDYRVGTAGKFPNNITDVKCAIRYIRANAVKYNMDPNRIGLAGDSAGGHLVFLAGLANASAGWDTGENANTSSEVQAVAGYSSPTYIDEEGRKWPQVWGTNTALWEKGSPTYWAKQNASKPPLLIVHGENDDTVPADHGPALKTAADAGGINATLQMVANAGHEMSGGNISPNAQTLVDQTVTFFLNHLGTATQPTQPVQISPSWNCIGSCPTDPPGVSPTIFNEPTQPVYEEPAPTEGTTEPTALPTNAFENPDDGGNGGNRPRGGYFSQFLAFLLALLRFLQELLSFR